MCDLLKEQVLWSCARHKSERTEAADAGSIMVGKDVLFLFMIYTWSSLNWSFRVPGIIRLGAFGTQDLLYRLVGEDTMLGQILRCSSFRSGVQVLQRCRTCNMLPSEDHTEGASVEDEKVTTIVILDSWYGYCAWCLRWS